MSRRGRLYLKTFRSVMGKYSHTNIGIPAAKGLFVLINAVMGQAPLWVNLENSTSVQQLVSGIRKLIQEASVEMTKWTELILGDTSCIAFIYTFGGGCKRVWMGATEELEIVVWRQECIPEIILSLITQKNPKGTLSISDLDMAALFLG